MTAKEFLANLDGNKLISEYMNKEIFWQKSALYPEGNWHLMAPIHEGLTPLQYHTSWDWIMPVLEKVCNEGGYWFEITIQGCRVGKRNEETAFIDNCSGIFPPSSCITVFLSVLEAIKHLAKQKGK